MNNTKYHKNGIKKATVLFLRSISFTLLGLTSVQVLAVTLDVSARFAPDPLNPRANTFTNTTPVSGYCATRPSECAASGTFSIAIPSLTLQSSTRIIANHTDPRNGAMLKVPANLIDVSVTSATGDVRNLKFRIKGFGGYQQFPQDVKIITGQPDNYLAHSAFWTGGRRWSNPRSPCGYTGVAGIGDTYYNFFWTTPSSGVCAAQAAMDIDSLGLDNINIAYELVTPEPLDMENGTYTGSVSYSIGPGGDFDFGDIWIPNDSLLTINLALSVEHIFAVQFPPGSDRLVLVPDGGWQQWLQRGQRPEKLSANQSFQIWSSTTFKMLLQCQYPVGDQCGIQNGAGDLVPVETRVTLPTGVVALTGMPVNRYLLSNSNARFFLPTEYVDNGRAALHFEVSRDSVVQMTNHAGSRYSGNVTIVFDSEI